MPTETSLELGNVQLRALETPGHSPESISILVYDLEADSEHPNALLSGDTLFIGDVGRPDLRASLGWTAEELGSLLYDSIQTKILPLPDDTLVYPAHGAGSLCGKHLSSETVSTIGIQRQYNYALQPMSREDFIRIVLADQPDSPAYFTYDAVLNTKERATLDEALAEGLTPLSLDQVLELVAGGAQLLDGRANLDFEGAHLRGAVNVGLDGSYATWVGTLLDHEKPIVIVVDPGREEEAALRLGRIGFDNLAGYLEGGMLALADRPDLIERTGRITIATLEEQLSEPDPPLVVDVRTEDERERDRRRGKRQHPARASHRTARRVAARPPARRALLGRLPVGRCGEPAAARGLRGRFRPGRRPQPLDPGAVSSTSLSSVFQLRAVPVTPRRRSR